MARTMMRRSGTRWRELAASAKHVVNGFWLAAAAKPGRILQSAFAGCCGHTEAAGPWCLF